MSNEGLSNRQEELIDKLFGAVDDMDEDTVIGIVLDVEHPDDTEEMLYYLSHGEDITKQNLVLFSLWLYNRRNHPERNLAGNDEF